MERKYPEAAEFEWDDGNRDKNLKHGVENRECEQVFFNEPLVVLDDPKHSVAEERCAAFGKTDRGRRLTVVYTVRGERIRVISARDVSWKERKFYEEAAEE
jgi:uncharacterized DUF497 family protein